jgi:hypothetical protein
MPLARFLFKPCDTPDSQAGALLGDKLMSPASGPELFVSFMTDEDVGTAPGNWVSNAAVKVMPATVAGEDVVFETAQRFVAGPFLSLWGGLCSYANRSYVL